MHGNEKRPRSRTCLNNPWEIPQKPIGHLLGIKVLLGEVEAAHLELDDRHPLAPESADALVLGKRYPTPRADEFEPFGVGDILISGSAIVFRQGDQG